LLYETYEERRQKKEARKREEQRMKLRIVMASVLIASGVMVSTAWAQAPLYKVLATSRTSTMEKEMKAAGAEGFHFTTVMGGETASAGNEVVVLMARSAKESSAKFDYRLLATSKTSTMQKELQDAGELGYQYVGQTVFESMFGGKEVVVIMEKDPAATNRTRWEYRLLATSKTSTMEKELRDTSELGFEALALTVGKTAMGGSELVVITRRKAK
jgi:hypothetical protein